MINKFVFIKGDKLPIKIDVTDFIESNTLDYATMSATPSEYFVADTGLTIPSTSYAPNILSVVVDSSGATVGESYNVTVKCITNTGLIKKFVGRVTVVERET